jgi:diguanylate cyclase
MTGRALGWMFQPRRRDEQLALWNRVAGVGLVLVLLAVSAFAVIASELTSGAARSAVAASGLSDDYATAAAAVAGEESLERKYRLEPGPDVRARYDETAAGFVRALGEVSRDGDGRDRVFVATMLAEHRGYLVAIGRLFRAVDRGDTRTVMRIDGNDVDPTFGAIEEAVVAAAAREHRESLTALSGLKHLEDITSRLTPLIFVLGLVIATVLASVTSGYRRLLAVERAQAVHDSLHDALSGLPNRTLLTDRLDQALRADARMGTSTGLLLIDLDRFKEVNDTFGHDYGDELLAQIGPRLAGVLRDVDTVARLGGDEFAVLLPEVGSVDNALMVAAKFRDALRASFQVCGIDLDVEASVGVVVSGEHGTDTVTLLQRADIAMYVAKSQNVGVFAYTADINKHSPARLALLGELRHALDHRDLVLHYQPKIAACTGDVIGAEALVRWEHPERGMIFPDDFIPLAEHTGLIGPLTHYVLDTALAQIRTWSDTGRPLTVSVNLSARNLLDERLPAEVAELLAVHGVPAQLLELEVTESALMSEPARAQQILERLAAMGVRISIDDFGAGYTSLSQIKTLPVSELKIDKSFVLSMTDDIDNAMIVRSVIDLGHSLGLTIVAEGVETHQALAALKEFGCDVAQGYLMSRPIPADALDTWLAGRSVLPPRPTDLLV